MPRTDRVGTRWSVLVAVALLLAPSAAELDDNAAADVVSVAYQVPVSGAVLRPFEPPSTPYGSGHRGVDLEAAPGDSVGAAAAGTVRFAGAVAGVRWVSIEHPDGIVTTYGPLADLAVGQGDQVRSGQRLGDLAPGGHGHGGADRGLHWGARRDGRYLDPLHLLRGVPRPSLTGPGRWHETRPP